MECSSPDVPCCAKCGSAHATNTCNSTEHKCVNCEKAGNDSNHTTFDPKCPCIMAEIEKKKNLNLRKIERDNSYAV